MYIVNSVISKIYKCVFKHAQQSLVNLGTHVKILMLVLTPVFVHKMTATKVRKGRDGLVVKVSASRPKDRGFEPHQGQDHVTP